MLPDIPCFRAMLISAARTREEQGHDVTSLLAARESAPESHDARSEAPWPTAWLTPFNDELRTAHARFHDRSLTAVARRLAQLPARLAIAR